MSDAQVPREYPLETESLGKGSVIPGAEIAKIFNVRIDSDRFGLAMLSACEYVTRRLGERGLDVVVTQRRGDLVVLTDADASTYTDREHRAGLRKAFRNHARAMRVDRGNLTGVERDAHDRRIEVQGRTLSAIRAARRAPAAIPVQRATPLPSGEPK